MNPPESNNEKHKDFWRVFVVCGNPWYTPKHAKRKNIFPHVFLRTNDTPNKQHVVRFQFLWISTDSSGIGQMTKRVQND